MIWAQSKWWKYQQLEKDKSFIFYHENFFDRGKVLVNRNILKWNRKKEEKLTLIRIKQVQKSELIYLEFESNSSVRVQVE